MKQCFRTGVRFSSSPPINNAIGEIVKIKIEKSSKVNGLRAFESKMEISIGQGFDAYSAPCGSQWNIQVAGNKKADKPLRGLSVFYLRHNKAIYFLELAKE